MTTATPELDCVLVDLPPWIEAEFGDEITSARRGSTSALFNTTLLPRISPHHVPEEYCYDEQDTVDWLSDYDATIERSDYETALQRLAQKRREWVIYRMREEGRFAILGTELTEFDRERIREMSHDAFTTFVDDVRGHLNVETIANDICVYGDIESKLPDDDPAEKVVSFLGDVVATWMEGQCADELRAVTHAVAAFDENPSRDADFTDVVAALVTKRRAVIEQLLADTVGTSNDIAADVESPLGDTESWTRTEFDGVMDRTRRLYPDSWKRAGRDSDALPLTIYSAPEYRGGYLGRMSPLTSGVRDGEEALVPDPDRRDQVIATATVRDERTLIHEIAHRMEDLHPPLRHLEERFLKRRVPTDVVMSQYHDDAHRVPLGVFPHAYTGKRYTSTGFREVLATGMDALFSGRNGAGVGAGVPDETEKLHATVTPSGRYIEDRDHVSFVLGLLLSARREEG